MTTELVGYVFDSEIDDTPGVVGCVRVLALLNPFTLARVERYVPAGQTVAEIVADLGLEDWKGALVSLDGEAVPPAWWARIRPHAGHLVVVRAVPRGGGGGGGNKGWIQIAVGAVLVVVGTLLALGTFGVGAAFGVPMVLMGLGMIATGAMTLLMPPPQQPKLKSGASDQPVFAITGSRNVANPYGAVPVVLGRHKIFPPFGALPYTEIVGNVQYLRQLFVVGYGPLELSDFKIGETPIEQYQEVETEIRYGQPGDTPMSLYPGDVFEDPLSISLARHQEGTPPAGPFVEPEPVRRTHDDVDEWSVDFVFASGLYHIDGDGALVSVGTRIRIWYRKVGDAEWILAEDKVHTAVTLQPLRRSYRQIVPERATYEIKMQQTGGSVGGSGLGSVTNAATWAVLRGILYRDPIALPGLCKIALRIRATDQLNGVVDQFSCIAHSVFPDYDAETDTWIARATSNPASIYRGILQGPANARPVADARIDLPSLQAWHTDCVETGRTFSFVVDQQTTVKELLSQVAAVGRASRGSIDGTFGVVRDIPQTVPIQHFTPRNSRSFRGSKIFRDLPHAIKARFINPDTGWDIDERFVYDDGYNDGNATKFEAIQFFGVTAADQAWKEARYHFAAARLRPEIYEFETDVEHIVCTRGDLVLLTHDVPLFGMGWGRLTDVALAGDGSATAIFVDEPLTMADDGTRYSVRIRRSDGSSLNREIVAVVGGTKLLTFVEAVPAGEVPAAGDLIGYGTLGQASVDAIVTRIDMLKDLGARITCVDAAPNIAEADSGPIPPHDPHITRLPGLPAPIVDAVRSDESVLVRAGDGALESRIVVFMHFASAPSTLIEAVDVFYRRSGSEDWIQVFGAGGSDAAQLSVMPVEDGLAYDIRLRAVSRSRGMTSGWTEIFGHVVIGKSTLPPDVTSFLIEGGFTRLTWSYPTPPLDLAGFLIRRHRGQRLTWELGQPIHDGVVTVSYYDLGVRDVGEVTYLIKAIDVAGNESLNSAAVVVNLGDPDPENILDTIDKHALGFPGTITNGELLGGDLVSSVLGSFWSGENARLHWIDDAALYWTQQYAELSYLTSVVPTATQSPCTIMLDVSVTGPEWALSYRTSGSALYWTTAGAAAWTGDANAVWTGAAEGFLPWPGRLEHAGNQVYEFLLVAAPGTVQAIVTDYVIILDAEEVREFIEDVAVAAGTGTDLPITKTYRVIRAVALTLQAVAGETAVTARIVNKNITGPHVECLAGNGVTVVAGTLDALVVGY